MSWMQVTGAVPRSARMQTTLANFFANQLRPVLVRYGSALLVVAITVGLRLWLDPVLGDTGFALFLIGMLTAAWVGGLGPCLICQTLILFAQAYWFSPTHKVHSPLTLHGIVSLAAFYSVGGTVAVLSEFWRASRKRLREQTAEALSVGERLRATLSCMGDGVVVTDEAGLVTLMNPVAEEMTGWSQEEARGKSATEVFSIREEPTGEPVENPVPRVLRREESLAGTMRLALQARSGLPLPISYTAAPIEDDQHGICGSVLILRDESERRQSERALRDADRRKDEFLATLAHELRNPLAPICTGIELIRMEGGDPAESQDVLEMMERQTRHMVRLVDDLLDVSRITRGKLELRRLQVPVSEIVQNAVEETKPTFESAEHRLEVRMPDEEVHVHGDPNRLTQVLSNLLDNAAKYTPRGGQIELSVEASGEDIEIAVTDNGRGISSDQLETIFDMFMQVRSAKESGHQGLGIGLTLVKQLVDMHGGSIRVESAGLERGSRFSVRLPAAKMQTELQHPQDARIAAEAAGKDFPRRVLVVDDNPDVRWLLALLLEQLGHEVYQGQDGLEAVEMAQRLGPEVVLMDLGMPKLNGYDAARRIRAEQWGQRLTLIATTGWGQETDRQRTKEAGFDGHLVKPIEKGTLQELFKSLPRANAPLPAANPMGNWPRNGAAAQSTPRVPSAESGGIV